jgi:hypothetical protein
MGRKPTYAPNDFIPRILEWIADGKTLREFCRQEGNPSYGTVYDWMEEDKDFASRFARARESGEDQIAQECLEIADNAKNDWMETKYGPQLNQEHVQRSKLRVETRLKLLAKWNPKKYGDKLQTEHSGEVKTIVVKPEAKDATPRPTLMPDFEQ